jgi:hypothetical protein
MRTVLGCSVVVLAVCLFSGCGDSGHWMDVPLVPCTEIPQFKTNDIFKMMTHNGCSNVGKAFTGDVRCEKDVVQIKCK